MLSNKVTKLAESAKYDVCLSSCSSGPGGQAGRTRRPENPLHEWIYPASVPGQGTVHILKILQSNRCTNRCTYCKFSASNDTEERTSLSPDELAKSFMEMVHLHLVKGIFLSSGVCRSPSYAMEEMIKTADILRNRYRFNGYIHLKIIPGSPEHLIEAAARLADRLSINIEAPSADHLNLIAPQKHLEKEILPAAARIASLLCSRNNGSSRSVRTKSQTTQYVVGAAGENDMDIMKSVDRLYRDYFMFRAYFSAYQDRYNPQAAAALKNTKAFAGSPLLREHRLYQCDFLLRAYGFRLPDLVFDQIGNIPLETDPKTAWAVMNKQIFPVEINTAPVEQLLRVPGIGPIAAERIVRIRKDNRFRNIEELKATGAWSNRAAGWIEISGKTPYIKGSGNRGKSGAESGFNPAQKWLFEEIAPEGWTTNEPVDTSGRESSALPTADSLSSGENYNYPGQKGKWVNYSFGDRYKKIRCR